MDPISLAAIAICLGVAGKAGSKYREIGRDVEENRAAQRRADAFLNALTPKDKR